MIYTTTEQITMSSIDVEERTNSSTFDSSSSRTRHYNTSTLHHQIRNTTTHPTFFAYKGVGFSLVKSLRALESFGMNVKVPITAHFPRYDKVQYLPRVGASVGMHFPVDYKCTFSASIPVLTAFYG